MVTKRAELRDFGSEGFVSFADLPTTTIPATQGVYAVLRCTQAPPEFLPRNPAGAIRGDPSVSPEALATAWVNGVEVVYFGKATRLQRRLEEYRRHGLGGRAPHWGGRYIWQLADANGFSLRGRPPRAQTPRASNQTSSAGSSRPPAVVHSRIETLAVGSPPDRRMKGFDSSCRWRPRSSS